MSAYGRRVIALGFCLALTACTTAPPGSLAPSVPGSRGGILRVGIPADFPPGSVLARTAADETGIGPERALDPQWLWYDTAELMRCCLARTLVSYPGVPTNEGGTIIQPDLAEALPDVSADGLIWTFRLKKGIHYAPPLDETEITAGDFVRSFHRLLRDIDPAFAPAIVGLEDYVSGRAQRIAGLETPDAYTLRIRLTRPHGDWPARLAFQDLLPIPPHPTDSAALFGVATGHDEDYGRFFVSSGPYMVEGAEAIDFTLPVADQRPPSGFVPGESLTLVRNDSWVAATDSLRPALPDRIEISIGDDVEQLAARVDAAELDLVLYSGPPPHSPVEQIERYRADPGLGSVHINSRDFVRAIAINMALPPFDDIHVRKAASLVLNKARLIELAGGPWAGEVAGHVVLNSLEDNLLLSYDPYQTDGSAGDLEAAKAEMRLSGYDGDADGICDDPACGSVSALTFLLNPGLAAAVAEDLARIGITIEEDSVDPGEAFPRWFDPAGRHGMMIGLAYGKDHLNASSFFTANFDGRTSTTDEMTNGTMIGATPERLRLWGYDSVEVASIDDRIDLCNRQSDGAQVQCWASLDQYLMENVVPWIPYSFERHVRTVSARVLAYSFDQSLALPALDRIAVPRE